MSIFVYTQLQSWEPVCNTANTSHPQGELVGHFGGPAWLPSRVLHFAGLFRPIFSDFRLVLRWRGECTVMLKSYSSHLSLKLQLLCVSFVGYSSVTVSSYVLFFFFLTESHIVIRFWFFSLTVRDCIASTICILSTVSHFFTTVRKCCLNLRLLIW